MELVVICVAALFVSAPISAAFFVSVASRREDRNWSLGQPPRGVIELIARRIVAFDADSIVWPRSKAQVRAKAERWRLVQGAAEKETKVRSRDAA
jgi:hypothetical protein